MKIETINAVGCEFCGHSERFSQPEQVGSDLDIYDVVRARVCRHEQRCPKNPLVKALMDIRELLVEVARGGSFLERVNAIKVVIQITFDCLGPKIERIPLEKNKKRPSIGHMERDHAVAIGKRDKLIESMGRANKFALEKIKDLDRQLADSRENKKTSKYYGVSLNKSSGKWKGQLQSGGRNTYLGMFVTEEEAAIAVLEKLGKKAEADRIRRILTKKQAAATEDKKQDADAAAGLDEIKGDIAWQWECRGCGETTRTRQDHCGKCNGRAFEKIPVLQ